MTQYLIGADPEVFVEDLQGAFVNGHGLIGGTKDNPLPVRLGAVQEDGMALEFNIDPARNRDEFVRNVTTVREQLASMIGPDLRLTPKPVQTFTREWFKAQPRASRIMGCDPDFDAWAGRMNKSPRNNVPMRTAAGHIHIGYTSGQDTYDFNAFVKASQVVRHLDSTVGLWTVLVDPGSAPRREMYGKAGAFRVKPYGCEWRVPSNFWLDPAFTAEMYDRVSDALDLYDTGDIRDSDQRVVEAINTSNTELAKELMNAAA
jgi:hypothetical protein